MGSPWQSPETQAPQEGWPTNAGSQLRHTARRSHPKPDKRAGGVLAATVVE